MSAHISHHDRLSWNNGFHSGANISTSCWRWRVASTPKCSMCRKHGGFKCPDCFGGPLLCKDCCVEFHRHSPFHRPLQWTSTHYTPVSLQSLGLVLFLGHNGAPCPQTVEVCTYPSI